MWAQTGMARSCKKRVVSAITAPPSSFTICAPAAISWADAANACSGLCWYAPNGKSATIMAFELPRATAAV